MSNIDLPLLKIDLFLLKEIYQLIMGLGFPVIFFVLLFSGMQQFDDLLFKLKLLKRYANFNDCIQCISFCILLSTLFYQRGRW